MKTLTELKRLIKPGVRLLCIENTLRPVLNGKIRLVEKAQGNAFVWRHDPQPDHSMIIKSIRPIEVECICGDWKYGQSEDQREMGSYRGDRTSWTDDELRATAVEKYGYHEHSAKQRSWTNYEKASAFTFDGSNTFTMTMAPGKAVTLQIL